MTFIASRSANASPSPTENLALFHVVPAFMNLPFEWNKILILKTEL
jgi:hypothetical protein